MKNGDIGKAAAGIYGINTAGIPAGSAFDTGLLVDKRAIVDKSNSQPRADIDARAAADADFSVYFHQLCSLVFIMLSCRTLIFVCTDAVTF